MFQNILYDSHPPSQSNSHNIAEHFTQYLCSWPGHFLSSALQRQNTGGFHTFRNCFPFCISAERIPQNFYSLFSVTEVFSYFHWYYNGYSCLILHCPGTLPDTLSHKTAILFFHIYWAPYSKIHHHYSYSHISLAVCLNNPPTILVPSY